jgi:hypothetical protein
MVRAWLGMLLALAAAVLSGSASAVEAKKPSELVTLEANDPCDLSRGQTYNLRVFPDGSTAPFSIPEGQVLVVTRWMFSFGAGSPGNGAIAVLKFDGTSSGVGVGHFTYDSEGTGGGTLELSAVVGAGKTLCGTHGDNAPGVGSLRGLLEGYLTKAK